jgi:hypothetical protein
MSVFRRQEYQGAGGGNKGVTREWQTLLRPAEAERRPRPARRSVSQSRRALSLPHILSATGAAKVFKSQA